MPAVNFEMKTIGAGLFVRREKLTKITNKCGGLLERGAPDLNVVDSECDFVGRRRPARLIHFPIII